MFTWITPHLKRNLQGYIKEDKTIEWWSGYYTPLLKAIRWMDYQQVSLPEEHQTSNPKSIVICVHPTGAPLNNGKPTITVTAVDTNDHSNFETVLKQEIPLPKANFKVPVSVEFKYKKGKYMFGSKLS